MKIFLIVVLVVLVFLAISSGVTKVLLMEQDVNFFGKYGFTKSILVGFGIAQIIGGCLLVFEGTRLIGASVVAITFFISLVLLVMEGNILISVFTIIALAMLGLLTRKRLVYAQNTGS